ncbi:hypothetical protein [Starkeya sp. ORNL1]|uniref:hypothetical protein n=1 Tax=Starkeya sp. ORNL1 TaxID=2709380 RepID=UPI001FEFF8CF|nr:hypothetical protein [Starkeya sp. ORNL1]
MATSRVALGRDFSACQERMSRARNTDECVPESRLSIEESIPNLVKVLLSVQGAPGLQYLDYLGRTVPW